MDESNLKELLFKKSPKSLCSDVEADIFAGIWCSLMISPSLTKYGKFDC